MKRLVILGFGGYGKTIEDVVLSGKLFDEVIFLDDKFSIRSSMRFFLLSVNLGIIKALYLMLVTVKISLF